MAWSIYGFTLNNSPLNDCNMVEVDQGWYSLMVFLLGIGVLCICGAAILTCMVPFIFYTLVRRDGGGAPDNEALISTLAREKFDTSKY
jgi:hypothetical protein